MTAQILFGVLLIAALFLAALLNLAADNQFRNRFTGVSAAIAACIGVLLYGYGFIHTMGLSVISVTRALLATCRMFSGVNDLGTIQNTPLMKNTVVLSIFWAGHFMAFYVTASAAIATLGGKLLRRIRVLLLKRGDLLVIYGVNDASLAYAGRRVRTEKLALLFVDDKYDHAFDSAISELGGIIQKQPEALEPSAAFLKYIGMRPGERKLCAAAMHEDRLRNLAWAQRLQAALDEVGIPPRQTSVILRDVEDRHAEHLLEKSGHGFGSVFAFDEYSLAARLMIRRVHPAQTIRFDTSGRATEDFSACVIGFGRLGRAVLDQLVCSGMFDGSSFSADIIDAKAQFGGLMHSQVMRGRDIRFHAFDGKSREFHDLLNEKKDVYRYIVICTGNSRENHEIAREIEFRYADSERIPAIIQITPSALLCSVDGKTDPSYQNIYASDAIDPENLDRLAMIVNQRYCRDNGRTAPENWNACDYFSRLSCRAFADFTPAYVFASGRTTRQLIADDHLPSEEMTETFARTEHLRWCAFHEVMGYHTMDMDTWQQRADAYRKEMSANGHSSIRIGKDTVHRLHACLIPWEELDALSERENRVTHGHTDYKEMDRENIRALPDLLRQSQRLED